MKKHFRNLGLWFIWFLVEILKRSKVVIVVAIFFFLLMMVLKNNFLWN